MSISANHPGERRFWAASLIILGTNGLATGFYPVAGFWSSYVLDIVGPAWNYILIRGLFAKNQTTFISTFFKPEVALGSIIAACFLIETAQFLNLYEAHFDYFDFLAYISLVVPFYIIDKCLLKRRVKHASLGMQNPGGDSNESSVA